MRSTTALGAILVGSAVLDFVFFTGFIASDDVLYTTAARKLAERGTLWPNPAPHETRLLMIGWCALVGVCVRHDVQAIAASFVAFHQALSVLTFALGRQLRGTGVGLLAAGLTATFPLLVVFSSTILPDIPMTVCLVAALLSLRSAELAPPGARLRLALSGAMVGLAYLAKESALISLPFFLVLVLVHRRGSLDGGHIRQALARAAALLAGLGVIVGLEAIALRALTGAWFFRLGALVEGGHDRTPSLAALGERATLLARTAGAHAGPSAAIAVIVLAAAIYAGRRPGLRSLLLFAAWYVAYYTWGSASFTSYYSPSLQARYLIPCIPFVVIPVSAALCDAQAFASEQARRLHPRADGMVRVLGASLLAAVAAVQLAVCDRDAGTLYGAPLVGQSVRALRQWSSSGRGPIVISDRVGEQIFPMLGRRPEGLLFSHEVGPDQIERWRRTGGFGFMDLHPTSPLRHPPLNPVLGWGQGLPASARHVERLVESLLGGATGTGWIMRPVGHFDRAGPRSAELRALLGDPDALRRLQYRPDRGVLVYHVTTTEQDVGYPLPTFDAARGPAVMNGTFERWSEAGPLDWHTRDTLASKATGPEGNEAVRIGPGAFSYVWQSLRAPDSARGRTLVLRAKVRSDVPQAARLWIRVAVGSDWEEAFGDPDGGGGTWQALEAALPLPLRFAGGEARIVLLHTGTRGHSEFDDVELSVH